MSKQVGDYILETLLGTGQFGKVYKAQHSKTKLFYAIKTVKRRVFEDNPKLKECTVNEINTLSKIDNEHVVKFIEMIKTNNNMYFVYEFCNGGTLEEDLISKGFFPEYEARKIFKQIVIGMDCVIKLNIIHRDIKPQNILFNDGKIKVADFGFCKPLGNKNEMTKTVLGSPIYMAPEILRGEDYTMKADIWSLGVLFYEILFGKCPYEGKSIANLITLLEETDFAFPNNFNVSSEMKLLLRAMLLKNPAKRAEWNFVVQTIIGSQEISVIDFKQIEKESPIKAETAPIESYEYTPTQEIDSNYLKKEINSFNKPLEQYSPFHNLALRPNLNPIEQTFSISHNESNLNKIEEYPNYKKLINKNSDNNTAEVNEPIKIFVKKDSLHESFAYKSEKFELNFSKFYKIQLKSNINSKKKFFQFILKERNKLYFLSKVYSDLFIYCNNEIKILILFQKYIYFHAVNLKDNGLSNFSQEIIKRISNFNEYKNSLEFKHMENFINSEIQKIFLSYNELKEKIMKDSINNFNEIEKMEIRNLNFIDLKLLINKIIDYISDLKNLIDQTMTEENKNKKIYIHCIEVLDSILINKLFDNFIDDESEFKEQKYFKIIKEQPNSILSYILNVKFDFIKKNFML